MKWHLWAVFAAVFVFSSATADETAIVTAGTGYLLDEAGKVVETVPFYQVLDVTGVRGRMVQVRVNGRRLQIHQGQVHQTTQLSYVTEQTRPQVRKVFQLLQQSAAAAAEQDFAAALRFVRQAGQDAEATFEQKSPLEPWVRQYEAWIHYAQEDYETAAAVLDSCEATLQEIGQQQHLQAADVMNVRGLLKQVAGEYDAAIDAFQRAVMIQISELGIDHQDTAIVHGNLSQACELHEKIGRAVTAQKISVRTLQSILPESAEELAAAYLRLGNLQRDNQQPDEAATAYEESLRLYQEYHPDQSTLSADLLVNVIYCTTEHGDFDAAERACRQLLEFAETLSDDDRRYYRRDALTRLGIIDHRQEDFDAALAHYYEAVEVADPDHYHVDDGNALENAGHALVSMEKTEKATRHYEKAIRIYALTEGADSEAVLVLREYIDDVDSYRDNSLGGYVQVALPRAYLLDDDGKVMDTVPGLSVLEWYSSGDEYHEVRFNDQLGRIANSQLHTRRQLPGYGVAQAPAYRTIMKHTADALRSLAQQENRGAEKHIHAAVESCGEEYGTQNSLWLWLKLQEAGIRLRTRGAESAQQALIQLDAAIDEINPNSYPVRVDAAAARAAVLLELGDSESAVTHLTTARDTAVERYGEQHAVVRELTRLLAKNEYHAGSYERAAVELRKVLKITEETLPAGSIEVPELVSELSLMLTESGEAAEAAQLLENVLGGEYALPRELHAMLVATLGRVYARLERADDAEELLTAVVTILQNNSPDAINIPAGLMALTELGKLRLEQQDWESAARHFQRAVDVTTALRLEDTFEAAEVHRQLAAAYQQLGQKPQAVKSLTRVLRIYRILGGEDSPQAESIRARLQQLTGDAPAPDSDSSAHAELLATHFDFRPLEEQMLITTEDCTVRASAEDDGAEVATLEAGTKVWSLTSEQEWHRIWLPEPQQYGWVSAGSLEDFESSLIEKGRMKLSDQLSDQPAALESCLAAFTEARPEGGFADTDQAIRTIQKSVATIESHYDDTNPLTALLYEDLLDLYEQSGQADMRLRTAEEQLTQFLFAHGYDHPTAAAARSVRAEHFRAVGNNTSEASELDEILKTCGRRFGPHDPRTRMQQLGLAANQVREGRFSEAAELYQEILQQETASDAPSFLRTVALQGQGGILTSQKRYSDAIRHLEEAADGYRSLNIPVPVLMAQTLHLLGWCHGQAGRPDEGIDLLHQAEAFVGGPADVTLQHSILTWKSRLAATAGSDQTVAFAATARELAEQAFAGAGIPQLDAWQATGVAEQYSDRAQSITAFDKARRLAHEYGQRIVKWQRSGRQISFCAEDQDRLNEALTCTLMEQGSEAAEMTASWWINGHQLLPEYLALSRQITGRLTSAGDQQTVQRWQRRRRQVAELPVKLDSTRIPPTVQQAVEQLQGEEQQAFDELPDSSRQMLSAGRDWIEVDQVRRQLRPGEVLIGFREIKGQPPTDDPLAAELIDDVSNSRYVAWVIPASPAGEIQLVEIGWVGSISMLVSQTLDLITDIAAENPAGAAAGKAFRQERDQLERLSRRVWWPIAAKLPQDTTHLTFCPDGPLNSIPWQALSHVDEESLVDRFTIRRITRPRDLLRDDVGLELSSPVILTDPEFLGQDAALTDLPRDDQKFLARRTEGSRLRLDKAKLRDAIDAEPNLAGEILDLIGERAKSTAARRQQRETQRQLTMKSCASAFGDGTIVLNGVEASEYRFFTAIRPRFLHITGATFASEPQRVDMTGAFASAESRMLIPAAHGQQFNPLMHCGVLLAGFGLDQAKHHLNDGVLTGEEIVSQDLRGTELVTLSIAPRTVNGSPARYNAATLLPQLFLLAGAETVVSGNWPVPEPWRLKFLEVFYRQLATGQEQAAALRAAQQEIRDSRKFVPAAFWAAFRLTGEGWNSVTVDATEGDTTTDSATVEEAVRSLALNVLQRYQKKDVKGLLSLTPDGAPSAEQLNAFAVGTSRHKSLFGASSWRWQAVSSWDGELSRVYYMRNRQPSSVDAANTALVEFGRSETEVFVVTLTKHDGSWTFDDIHSPDASDLPER